MNLKQLWYRLSNIGVEENMEIGISKRVILANRFSLFILALLIALFMPAIFSGGDGGTAKEGQWVVFALLILPFAVLGLNALGFHQAGRFFLSVTPSVLLVINSFYQKLATTMTLEIVSYVDVRIMLVPLAAFPWIFFSTKEKVPFYLAGAVALVPTLFFDGIHELFGAGYQQLGLTSEIYPIVSSLTFFSLSMLLGLLFFLNHVNEGFERSNNQLLEDLQQKNKEAEKNEDRLHQTLTEIEETRKVEEKRRWITDGVTAISEVLRKHSDLGDMSHELLKNIIKYLTAHQGAMYVLEETDEGEKELDMVSAYAIDRRKYIQKRISPGDGLVGQAYLEKAPTYLADIPEGYCKITSGLGEVQPKFLALHPLLHNEKVVGILELASLTPMDQTHFDFLEKIGEVVASAIANAKINTRTQQLLAKAQEQREVVQAQEEEMRQNVEELEATQEEMRRVQKRLHEEKAEAEQKIKALQEEVAELKMEKQVASPD